MSDFRTYDKVSRRPASPLGFVEDPADWSPSSLGDVSRWCYRISEKNIDEIYDALRAFDGSGRSAADINPETFPLDAFSDTLKDIRRELRDGRGIVMMRDFPVDRMELDDIAKAYLGIGSHIGRVMMQNSSGHILGHVRDIGNDYSVTRGYGTRAELRFHNDGCDYVGLICLQTAKAGGESRIASSVHVYNTLLARRPDLVEILLGEFYRTNNGEGETPWFSQPVFAFTEGYFSAMGLGSTIEKAQSLPGVPPLTAIQKEAIAVYRATVAECAIDIPFVPGDIQFLNNSVTLHSRRAFEDWPESHRKRHLLRLWLTDDAGRPVPESTANSRSKQGIKLPGLLPVVPESPIL